MKNLILIFLCFCSTWSYAQFSRHIIELNNKQATTHTLDNPSAFLSPKAIARRAKYNISIDSTDLPVPKAYLDSISSVANVKILNTSKWLNLVLIQTTDAAALTKIQSFPFVKKTSAIAKRVINDYHAEDKFEDITNEGFYRNFRKQSVRSFYDYGNSFGQIHIHEGEFLHDNGFRGQGMTVAILDAGFLGYQTNPAFDSLRAGNQIKGSWDFVKNESSVNEDHVHGMYCLSIIAANKPGALVGTAPKADYYLFRTEEAATEYPVEEQNWAAAAEMADSLGADLITSSLGYTEFDNAVFNHTYADLNGRLTIITRAADFAAKKGMIVTNSAGNSGNDTWKYISAPADGDSVLAVGAVNVNGQPAAFSSYGPSADGRVKPDVASVGWNTFIINTSGNVAQGNGTSFSNPNLAGLITCLWQAFPEMTNMEIINAVRQSSGKYSNPDDRVGYGIPNMRAAYEALQKERERRNAGAILGQQNIRVYPVPITHSFKVLYRASRTGSLSLELIDASGRVISSQKQDIQNNEIYFINMNQPANLPAGAYFLRYNDGQSGNVIRLLK